MVTLTAVFAILLGQASPQAAFAILLLPVNASASLPLGLPIAASSESSEPKSSNVGIQAAGTTAGSPEIGIIGTSTRARSEKATSSLNAAPSSSLIQPTPPANISVSLMPLVESESRPERKGPAILPLVKPQKIKKSDISGQAAQLEKRETADIQSLEATSLGANLIQNPSMETAGSNGLPSSWFKGGYGTNNRTLTYPVDGSNGAKGAKVDITNYTSGDVKWYFADVTVTPSKTYQFSNQSLSNVTTYLTVRFKKSDGTWSYDNIATVSPSASFQTNTAQFTIPANVVSVTVFHLLNAVGTLTVDNYSLNEVTSDTPPPSTSGLIINGDFESADSSGLPINWLKGAWGTNTRSFSYPTTGVNGSRAAEVSIQSYSSGDAKWYFKPLNLPPGIYTYKDQYLSNTTSYVTIQYQHTNGTYTYKDLASVAPAGSFGQLTFDFDVPSGVSNVTVFHLIKSVGYLRIDNVFLEQKSVTPGVFTTGGVTLRFDDGWLSQYQNALPKLSNSGLKGTFYIVTRQLSDNGFPGYMSQSQIRNIYNAGHEIGSHTRTHSDLTSLSFSAQQSEISGSRSDLLSWDVGPIKAFSYPFGAYNSTTMSLVQDAGYSSAAATIDGEVHPTSDPYQLERRGVTSSVTAAEAKQWIDNAIANKRWLILSFHAVDYSGTLYSTTPEVFNEIIDYLKSKNVPVVTTSEGIQSL